MQADRRDIARDLQATQNPHKAWYHFQQVIDDWFARTEHEVPCRPNIKTGSST
jgi:hypothetical protein